MDGTIPFEFAGELDLPLGRLGFVAAARVPAAARRLAPSPFF
jgi:hypothetical protein